MSNSGAKRLILLPNAKGLEFVVVVVVIIIIIIILVSSVNKTGLDLSDIILETLFNIKKKK
jgi:hypothetical protein